MVYGHSTSRHTKKHTSYISMYSIECLLKICYSSWSISGELKEKKKHCKSHYKRSITKLKSNIFFISPLKYCTIFECFNSISWSCIFMNPWSFLIFWDVKEKTFKFEKDLIFEYISVLTECTSSFKRMILPFPLHNQCLKQENLKEKIYLFNVSI